LLKDAEAESSSVAASAISPLADKENKESTEASGATTSVAAADEEDGLDFTKIKKKKKAAQVKFDDGQNEVIEVIKRDQFFLYFDLFLNGFILKFQDPALDPNVKAGEQKLLTESDGVSGWQGSERDYTYDELLTRVFNIMREKNPDMITGEKRKFVMKPPQVNRVGTKKTSFSNFADICKL